MPTYVYKREDGTVFELVQRITESALETDPETGQKVRRVISGAGFVLKGSGFYQTDYKPHVAPKSTAESKPAESAPSDAASPAAKPADAKPAESKPAATPAPKSGD